MCVTSTSLCRASALMCVIMALLHGNPVYGSEHRYLTAGRLDEWFWACNHRHTKPTGQPNGGPSRDRRDCVRFPQGELLQAHPKAIELENCILAGISKPLLDVGMQGVGQSNEPFYAVYFNAQEVPAGTVVTVYENVRPSPKFASVSVITRLSLQSDAYVQHGHTTYTSGAYLRI